MCILSLFDVFLISNRYEMDLIWMELRTTQMENYGGIVDGKGTRLEDGTFKNNGHTAVL